MKKKQFAAMVKPIHFSYAKTDFHMKDVDGSCILTDSLVLGDNYNLYSLHTANHVFEYMSPDAYPSLSISGSDTFGYAIPDRASDDISEDVAEMVVAGRNEIIEENSDVQYVAPVIHKYGPGETFDDLRRKIVEEGRQLYLTGFPGEYYREDFHQRMTFEVRLLDITVYEDEDVKYVFDFVPSGINGNLPSNMLPGCSGGALGYIENGVPHIIGIMHGYDSESWLAASLNTSYGSDFINGARNAIDTLYKQPTTKGLNNIKPDIETPQQVSNLTDLSWFLLKHSNYPIEELSDMLRFQDMLDIHSLALDSLIFYNKAPLLIVKNNEGDKRSFLWDRKQKKFVDFSG